MYVLDFLVLLFTKALLIKAQAPAQAADPKACMQRKEECHSRFQRAAAPTNYYYYY